MNKLSTLLIAAVVAVAFPAQAGSIDITPPPPVFAQPTVTDLGNDMIEFRGAGFAATMALGYRYDRDYVPPEVLAARAPLAIA
jgi:hypothetical protein